MADVPWFLQALGLPPYADVAAVRRAYAKALRAINPSADPDAFARLREAYETARAWCEQAGTEDDAVAPASPASTPSVIDDATVTDESSAPAQDVGADARREAALLTEVFVAGVSDGSDAHAVELLERTIAALRTRYIDAPGELEERLIDLLAGQGVPHRAALFDAATQLFHWEDVGQLPPLGERGQWVEAVLTQQAAWMHVDPTLRKQWLEPVTRATLPIDASLVGHWPTVDRLCTQYPQWIGLHLHHTVAHAWRTSFSALPASVQDRQRQKAVLRATKGTPATKRRRYTLLGFALVLLLGALGNAGEVIFSGHDDVLVFRWPWSGSQDTPRTCADLYQQLSRQDAFAGLNAEAIRTLIRRGERCERSGYWHPPSRNDRP